MASTSQSPERQRLERNARMFMSRALNRSLAPPDWLSINLTLRCNLSCTMCTTCYDVPDELSTAEIKDLIDQAAQMGIQVFNPLGGELFMRGDLEEILEHAASAGFYVTVTTNGTLINTRRAQMLATIPPSRLHMTISLDGGEPEHDSIRGEGMYRRAMTGYRRLRDADTAAGNPRRKVLANTIVHRRNLHTLPAFLDELAAQGFDGVQLLNLFRHGPDTPKEGRDLWIREQDQQALEALVAELKRRVRAPRPGFEILNSEQDLELIARYYREDISPLEAPCWAGWKELYINSDGQAVMCDGNLDFLKGAFGSTRKQTLQQLWGSQTLRARREVVKACTTPCIQNCYLRRDSDSAQALGGGAARLISQGFKRRASQALGRFSRKRISRISGGVLRLELSDMAPVASLDPSASRRFADFAKGCPTPVSEAWTDEAAWNSLRNRGYLDFGRGFMGLELVRRVIADLRQAGLVFPAVQLSWRGEPLLHPEREEVLREVLSAISDHGVFERLIVETDGRLLGPRIASIIREFGEIPQIWILNGNAMGQEEERARENWLHLAQTRGPATQLLMAWTVVEDMDPFSWSEPWQERFPGLPIAVGPMPTAGDSIWFRRSDHDHFQATAQARERLEEVAEVLDLPCESGREDSPRRCPGVFATPTVSWDGKVVLCPWDISLKNRMGEVTSGALSEIWLEDQQVLAQRRHAKVAGVPSLEACRDCHYPYSPNYVDRNSTAGE